MLSIYSLSLCIQIFHGTIVFPNLIIVCIIFLFFNTWIWTVKKRTAHRMRPCGKDRNILKHTQDPFMVFEAKYKGTYLAWKCKATFIRRLFDEKDPLAIIVYNNCISLSFNGNNVFVLLRLVVSINVYVCGVYTVGGKKLKFDVWNSHSIPPDDRILHTGIGSNLKPQ